MSRKSAALIVSLMTMAALAAALSPAQIPKAGAAALGTHKYAAFETPKSCGACHTDFYQQWTQSLMSQSYTHAWDEIEYFKLALPHAAKDGAVAEVKAGCTGCHAPLAFLAGEVPPPRPSANSRANESVSCDICHTITGFGSRLYLPWLSTALVA